MIFDKEQMAKLYGMSLEDLVKMKNEYKKKLDIVDGILKLRKKNGEQLVSEQKPKERKVETDNPYQQ